MKYPTTLFVSIFLCLIIIGSCNKKQSVTQKDENKAEVLQKAEENEAASSESTEREAKPVKEISEISLDTLLGKWLRPDGNYVIQINAIKEDKKIDAQYFNPNPINISRAEVIPDNNLRIFIEFDDRGYEGSSYDLTYDPQNDALIGKYFQATYGQTYQIGFVRLEK